LDGGAHELQRVLEKPLANGLRTPLMRHASSFFLLIGNT
jgi:hypothetical protein